MNPLFIAGTWLAIAALASLLIGGGLRVGQRRPSPQPPRRRTAADFAALPLESWTSAAHAAATEALLDTRPGVIRRVADPFSELDG